MKRRDFICGIAGLSIGCLCTHLIDRKIFPDLEKMYKSNLGGFTVSLSSHCNLNCKGCDMYAPLSKPEFVRLEDYSKDIDKLKKLDPERELGIAFMGGEPLLNPEIIPIIKKTCEAYPNATHTILTNGILIEKMSDDFFKMLKDCKINFRVTKYPININFKKIEDKLSSIDINWGYDLLNTKQLFDLKTHKPIEDKNFKPEKNGFEWSKNILDLEGTQDPIEKKLMCPHKGIRAYARGNIYACYVHAGISAFIDYFKVNIPITEKDYIKIANVKDIKEIDDFLSTPKPLCKYCKECHNTCYNEEPLDWGFSERKITEWT